MAKPAQRSRAVTAANDNAPGTQSSAQPDAPYPSISPLQLEILKPLIAALVEQAANDLDSDPCEGRARQRRAVARTVQKRQSTDNSNRKGQSQ